jgi:4-hydroxy-3-methylbut-2-enyl diphosphate reductase IspH
LHLHLANEENADRRWLGSVHLVAIYARALTPEEVARNFDAGPCP